MTHAPDHRPDSQDALVRYVEAIGRNPGEEKQCSHLYEIRTIDGEEVMRPMCRKGWNRSDGEGFSIFRGWRGAKGLCKTCERRKKEGLPGVDAREGSHKTKWI